jgi:hypothetical protein
MVDNGDNILVEFDYQNISVIDPNKVIDQNGNPQERLINQENLVYYANLECSVLPRTKLALGVPLSETVRTISIGSINFLNPGQKDFLDTDWSDEITGKNTLQGKGVNQKNINENKGSGKSEEYYYSQSLVSNGNPGAVDNGLLGINQINISYSTDFMPVIAITLEDVKGKALFEGGNNSPYAAFFQLPYPLFYLTIKGYLGKAVRLPLMLQSFNASFMPDSGNFRVELKLYTYKYTIMSHINWGGMMAAPLMYQSSVKTKKTTTTNNGNPNDSVTSSWSSIGYSKMKELYATYKSKGLIDDNFPEITLQELKVRLNQFLKNIIEDYSKTNLDVLNDLEIYSKVLSEYESIVFIRSEDCWARKYLDFTDTFVGKTQTGSNENVTYYKFKKEYNTAEKQSQALTELSGIVKSNNNSLKTNKTLGDNKPNSIPVDITLDLNKSTSTFYKTVFVNDIDLEKTYFQRVNKQLPSTETESFSKQVTADIGEGARLFYFYGAGSFFNKTTTIAENFQIQKQKIEEGLTKDLANKVSATFVSDGKGGGTGGIGFAPTIRNVLAVFFAQGESFLRLLDDVHTKAWDLRDDELRKNAILSNSSTVNSVDQKDLSFKDTPIYPWPQMIVENNLKEDGERFELKYPGDPSIATKVRAFSPEIWPEVQFVEEFIKGTIEKSTPDQFPTSVANSQTKPSRLSFNAIEFPITNEVYQNTEEVKFFYEIYERMLINSFYSKLSRDSNKTFNMSEHYAESEVLDIIEALGSDNPYLTKKLKEYNLTSSSYLAFLRHISNEGSGESWQNYIRGEFNTSYLKNDVNTSFELFNGDITDNDKSKPLLSLKNPSYAESYFGDNNNIENYDFTDLYPITNLDWDNTYLANAKGIQDEKSVFKTTQVLRYNNTNKMITNFELGGKDKEPITNFNYKSSIFNQSIDFTTLNLKTFYENRKFENQYITEGNVYYSNYENLLTSTQTTSMLNTPYFVNAIQEGVYNYRYKSNDLYPYRSAAFLFLNSLPLSTLREKYKQDNDNGSSTDLDYIISTFKKFGAVHKLPYAWVLKYGSIWHRYKTWVDTGVDILDNVWKDFNYSYNYDPTNSATTKVYDVVINGVNKSIVLQENVTNGTDTQTNINLGFYPKLIDDYNVFLQGKKVFGVTPQSINGTCQINGTTLEILTISGNDLFVGAAISGSGISIGTTILQQLTGTAGGIGTYLIDNSQTVTSTQFIVTNQNVYGYTSSEIQSAIGNQLFMVNTTSSLIFKTPGFDLGDLTRGLYITPWSCYSTSNDGGYIYPMPSFGSIINQTNDECFRTNGTMKTEVLDNTSMYNGSVRTFWKAPNYGYFDNTRVEIPTPDSYLKEVFNDVSIQQNFSINGNDGDYSKISELFTTFNKDILDLLETEFLNFSRSVYDYQATLKTTSQLETEDDKINKNFQLLMRSIMKLPKPTTSDTNGNNIVNEIQNSQIGNFTSYFNSFMTYKVTMKYGNPSDYNKKLFYTFSNQYIVDPYSYQGYKQSSPNSLPTAGGSITLAQSKTQYPETWKTLETYVGFSEIPELVYSNNGSYITDFFVDMDVEFNEKNVTNFAPIIKIYATQKLNNNGITKTEFFNLMDDYVAKNTTYLNTVLDLELTRLRKELPNVTITQTDGNVKSSLEGEQTRYELWELFKTINDTWISGTDFKTKTLFEDVLLMDRASRDVGQKVYVDIFKLKDLIENATYKNSLLSIVQTILVNNNFVNFTLPAYANFYNVRDVSKNPSPKPEGTLEFANTLFGTFLNVDYRETSAKFLCLYANKPSEHLAINDNVDYRFRDDAFDLRRSTDNPLLENQDGKTNWDKSNKVVGFNVDIGPQNQQIFKQFDVSQDPGLPTTESLEVLNQMANLDKNRAGYSQSVSLYNLYKNRSYKCSIDMMGNALMQPMMYFNLRNVPMFSGPYMITKVSHRISENGFDTTIEGQRQPFYSIPKIENFIQTLSTKILQNIKERVQQTDKTTNLATTNVIAQSNQITTTTNTSISLSVNQNCGDKLVDPYKNYTTETATLTEINISDAINTINSKVNQIDGGNKSLGLLIYSIMSLKTPLSVVFKNYNHNYGRVPLTFPYSQSANSFKNTYFCDDLNTPMAIFETFENFVDFMISKYNGKITKLNDYGLEFTQYSDLQKLSKSIVKFYVNNYPNDSTTDFYNVVPESDKTNWEKIVSDAIGTYNQIIGQETSDAQTSINPFIEDRNSPAGVFNSLSVSIDQTKGKWNIISATDSYYKITALCNQGTGNGLGSFDNNITTNKQTFLINKTQLLQFYSCYSVPVQDISGQYDINIELIASPVLEDGTLDTTREQRIKVFPIKFIMP